MGTKNVPKSDLKKIIKKNRKSFPDFLQNVCIFTIVYIC